MPKNPYKEQEQWLINVLTQYVNTGAFSAEDADSFEATWHTLSANKQDALSRSVALNCLTLHDGMFLGKALGHSQAIMRNAIGFLIIAGTGTYLATGNPLASICVGSIAGVAGGMLTLTGYKNMYIEEAAKTNFSKKERLNLYAPG